MDKDKQIKEMAKDMCEYYYEGTCYQDKKPCDCECEIFTDAQYLYAKGYRKERQGEWFIREYEFFTCSECGHDYWNSCDCTKEAKEKLADGDTPNYCSNCGAKMKGE